MAEVCLRHVTTTLRYLVCVGGSQTQQYRTTSIRIPKKEKRIRIAQILYTFLVHPRSFDGVISW